MAGGETPFSHTMTGLVQRPSSGQLYKFAPTVLVEGVTTVLQPTSAREAGQLLRRLRRL